MAISYANKSLSMTSNTSSESFTKSIKVDYGGKILTTIYHGYALYILQDSHQQAISNKG